VYIEKSCGISSGLLARTNQLHNLLLLVRLEFWAATTDASLLSCSIQSYVSSFLQHGPLKFSKRAY
jgi:hypothetical protein